MLYLSRFTPESERVTDWIAALWQGPVPQSLTIRHYLYLESDGLVISLLWEGDDDAVAFMRRTFETFGEFTVESAIDNTTGLQLAMARDLETFGNRMLARGEDPAEVERALDLRRRGTLAATQDDAVAAARAWAAQHGSVG